MAGITLLIGIGGWTADTPHIEPGELANKQRTTKYD